MRGARSGSMPPQNIHEAAKPAQAVIRIFCELPLQEIFMPSGKWRGLLRITLVFASTAAILLPAHAALASQGLGGGPGTASHFTQLAMAIVVYGTSVLVIGSGLIGALRNTENGRT
jgi:hypothetical protein